MRSTLRSEMLTRKCILKTTGVVMWNVVKCIVKCSEVCYEGWDGVQWNSTWGTVINIVKWDEMQQSNMYDLLPFEWYNVICLEQPLLEIREICDNNEFLLQIAINTNFASLWSYTQANGKVADWLHVLEILFWLTGESEGGIRSMILELGR